MKTTHRLLLAGILLTCSAWAESDPGGVACWEALRGKNAASGATKDMVDHTLAICRKRGLTPADADKLFQPVYAARAESLPVCCIYQKIDEGLSKHASVTNILQAVETRLNHLRQAKQMVAGLLGVTGHHGKGVTMLVENTGMALESGLDAEVVSAAFSHNGYRKLGRLAHVMEAAERLHLGGFEDRDIQRVLFDFIDRNLSRHEIFRAVEVLEDGVARGKDFNEVYDVLWVSSR